MDKSVIQTILNIFTRNISSSTTFVPRESPVTSGSTETPEPPETSEDIFDYVIHTYVYRAIYALGFVGNMISLLVWIRTRNRAPPIFFFISICVTDTLVLITHSIEKHSIYIPVICQLVHIAFFAVQVFAILLVVGMSVEQYISVCRPLKESITPRRTWKAIVCLALLSVVGSSLEGYFWALDEQREICTIRKAVFLVYHWIYGYAVLSIHFIFPVIIIMTLNVLVWKAIKKSRHRTLAYGRSMRKVKTRFNMTFHLISLHLALGELLYAVIHISRYGLYVEGHANDHLPGRWPSYYITSPPYLIADVVSLSSYALDITLFTLSSRTFRKAALNAIGFNKKPIPTDDSLESQCACVPPPVTS